MNKTPYKSILQFFWSSKTKYSLHSPFVFDFFNEVMNKKVGNNEVLAIEECRSEFIKDHSLIDFIEYGAGSKKSNGDSRKISSVATSSLSGKWQCRLIYNMIQHYSPKTILEIGTSLGISTSYLAAASSNSKIITLEGNPSSAAIANKLFDNLGFQNVQLTLGAFEDTLRSTIDSFDGIDCAFIDGNHRKQATIDYFHMIRHKLSAKSFVIIDDIYWSQGMNEAWQEIIMHESVAFSIDVFRMGIVFFDHSVMEKQHFKLIESKWKLWSIGVFG